MSRYQCINAEFDPKGLKVYDSLDAFLNEVHGMKLPVPEVLVRGRSILTRKQGSKNSRDWVATLVDLSTGLGVPGLVASSVTKLKGVGDGS